MTLTEKIKKKWVSMPETKGMPDKVLELDADNYNNYICGDLEIAFNQTINTIIYFGMFYDGYHTKNYIVDEKHKDRLKMLESVITTLFHNTKRVGVDKNITIIKSMINDFFNYVKIQERITHLNKRLKNYKMIKFNNDISMIFENLELFFSEQEYKKSDLEFLKEVIENICDTTIDQAYEQRSENNDIIAPLGTINIRGVANHMVKDPLWYWYQMGKEIKKEKQSNA